MKLTMDEREKSYFQKLPLALRQRIAVCLNQPELIPPDGRRARREHRLASLQYEVKSKLYGKERLSLEGAARRCQMSVAVFNEMLAAAYEKKFKRGAMTMTTLVGGDEVTVTKVNT